MTRGEILQRLDAMSRPLRLTLEDDQRIARRGQMTARCPHAVVIRHALAASRRLARDVARNRLESAADPGNSGNRATTKPPAASEAMDPAPDTTPVPARPAGSCGLGPAARPATEQRP